MDSAGPEASTAWTGGGAGAGDAGRRPRDGVPDGPLRLRVRSLGPSHPAPGTRPWRFAAIALSNLAPGIAMECAPGGLGGGISGRCLLGPRHPASAGVGPPAPVLPWMPWIGPGVVAAWAAVVSILLTQAWRFRRRSDRSRLLPTLAGLAASAALAAAISAAQLFPVVEFVMGTARTFDRGPHEIYSFSLEPAQLAELVWPNVYGTLLAGNSSWLSAVQLGNKPAKIWSPSLYISAFTFVFSLSAMRFEVRVNQRGMSGCRQSRW